MLSTIGKTMIAGTVMALGLGFGANKAAADSFSVSVHTPSVSAGYSNHRGHDSGYVEVYRPAPPPPVVVTRPAWSPVVVHQPPVVVVSKPRHVCSWDRVPVTHVRYDECGRRIYYTEYTKVRVCEDYHRGHGHGNYKHGHHGHDKHGHGHYKHDDHHKHGKHHDRDDDHRYSRRWDDDDDDDHRHGNRRGRDDD